MLAWSKLFLFDVILLYLILSLRVFAWTDVYYLSVIRSTVSAPFLSPILSGNFNFGMFIFDIGLAFSDVSLIFAYGSYFLLWWVIYVLKSWISTVFIRLFLLEVIDSSYFKSVFEFGLYNVGRALDITKRSEEIHLCS